MPKLEPVILLAFANDRGAGGRYLGDLPEELREIREALDAGRTAGLWEVVERPNCTIDDIYRVFQKAEYRNRVAVFHFAGHAGSYQLLLEQSDGSAAPIDAAGFAAFLAQQLGLQFVFLNGCSTAAQVDGLLAANVATVIATSQSIGDTAATRFASLFYRGLAGGAGVQTAFDEASAALRMENRGNTRDLYQAGAEADGLPWALRFRSGADDVAGRWSLGVAAGDPLFGIPPVPQGDLPELPYRHLEWFGREHAEIFFGRGKEIRELYERVTSGESAPILLLYGQSGVGKSSLLDAGLLPRLLNSHETRYTRRDQSLGLRGTLERALGVGAGSNAAEAWRALEGSSGKPLLVVLDQAEEAFTRPRPGGPNEPAELATALKEIFGDPGTRPQGKLLLSFRKEWLAEIESCLAQATLPRAKVFLSRLDRAGIVEAITGPAVVERLQKRWGLSIEDGLAENIADELLEDPESNIGPTLQVLLTKLWSEAIKQSASQPHFSRDLYLVLKRQGVLLRDFLDQQLAALRERWKTRYQIPDTGLALDALHYHTTPLGTSARRTAAEIAEAYGHVASTIGRSMIQDFKDLFLLADDSRDRSQDDGATRLTHDTLAPMVRYRFDNSASLGQLARRILETRAREWADGQTGTSLDERDLGLVEGGAAGMRDWTTNEQRLIEASRKMREEAQRTRKLMWAGGITLVILVLAFGAWGFRSAREARKQAARAEEQTRTAEEQTRVAEEQRKAALAGTFAAMSIAERNDSSALDLALQGVDWYVTYEATQALRDALQRNGSDFILRHSGQVDYAAFSSDGRKIVTATHGDRTAVVWTLATRDSIQSPRLDWNVFGAKFDATGTHVLITSAEEAADIWTPATKAMTRLCCHRNPIAYGEFSPDGNRVLTASWDGTVRVWDLAGRELERLGSPGPRVGFASFSPDGRFVASGNDSGDVRVWNLETKAGIRFAGHTGAVTYVGFSPKGDRLVTASKDNTARIWAVAGGVADTVRKSDLVLKHAGVVNSAVFSPDGEKVLTASDDKMSRQWDARTGKAAEEPVPHHTALVRYAEYSPDGRLFVTASDDGTSMIRNAETGEVVATLKGHDGAVLHAAFSRDGRYVVTAGEDRTARVFIVRSSELRDSAVALQGRPRGGY
jgi:WD40 repeat protein